MMTASPESSVIKMKRFLSLILALTIVAVSLASCKKVVKMEYTDEGDLRCENGTVYKYAPLGYEPTVQGEEYGLIEGVMEEKLYKIGDISPDEWLTTEYAGAATTIYYSADITLPTLSELSPDLCYICETGDEVASIYTLGGGHQPEAEREAMEKIIEMLSDESVEASLWPRMNATGYLDLKFYSEDWPAIYYNLDYTREGDQNFVYDRVSRKCVEVGDLIERFLGDGK